MQNLKFVRSCFSFENEEVLEGVQSKYLKISTYPAVATAPVVAYASSFEARRMGPKAVAQAAATLLHGAAARVRAKVFAM